MDRWAEVKESVGEGNGSSRSSHLPSLLKLIRFPLMSVESFSEHVVPRNVLSKEDIIALFMFFAGYEAQIIFDSYSQGVLLS
jgi:hypothetical protein